MKGVVLKKTQEGGGQRVLTGKCDEKCYCWGRHRKLGNMVYSTGR